MKATIRYGLLKALPLASKAFLLGISPRLLYAAVQPSAANAIIFLLSTLGYISLLAPGRELLAIQRFNNHSAYKSSPSSNSFLNGLAKYVYLLLLPAIFYSFAIYSFVKISAVGLLLLFVCLVSVIDNYLLPYKAEAHICANPEKAYLLQSIFSIPSIIFLLLSTINTSPSASLWLLMCSFGIYYAGQLIATLYFRCMVQASKAESGFETFPKSHQNQHRPLMTRVRIDNAYIRLAPILTMLVFGLLPYYYYFSSNQADYQQLMTFYPMFILPSTALGSLYFTRMHAKMRVDYLKCGIHGLKRYSLRLLVVISIANAFGSFLVLVCLRVAASNFNINLFPFFALIAALNAPLIILPSLLLSADQAIVLVQALMLTLFLSLLSNVFFCLSVPDVSLPAYLVFMSFLLVAFTVVSLILLCSRLHVSARVGPGLSAR